MSARQKIISRLIADTSLRADYIRAKLDVLIPSQLRALRLRQEKTQPELAQMADMKQSRISAMETPGKVNFNQETLVRMAATLNVAMKVEFVPFSEMLEWENSYSQDTFDVTRLPDDVDFLESKPRGVRKRRKRNPGVRRSSRVGMVRVIVTGTNVLSAVAASQQGTRMKLELTPSVPPLPGPLRNVITLPSKPSTVNAILASAVVSGAGRNYGR
jgi:transcriptional regulator with XRE-family HTH domain